MESIAFHGKPAVKAKYLRRVQTHRLADQILQGYGYWKDGKGCAVGCTIHGTNPAVYETELGIPLQLAGIEDRLFEGMSNDRSKVWPERFLTAIPVGADLSQIWPQFVTWLLLDKSDGVIQYVDSDDERHVIQQVAELYCTGCTDRMRWIAAQQDATFYFDDRKKIPYATRALYAAVGAARLAANSSVSSLGKNRSNDEAALAVRLTSHYAGQAVEEAATAVYWATDASDISTACELRAEKLLELLAAAPLNFRPV